MEEYEIHCDPVITEPYTWRFSDLAEAKQQAAGLCSAYRSTVRVVRVLGVYVPEARWISNGVPGAE